LGTMYASASSNVTAEELEHIVAVAVHQPDAEAAREISGLVLTERLSSARLARCLVDLPGPRAKDALLAVADTSAFLLPPRTEIPDLAEPDTAAQRRIMELAANYVKSTIRNLPNLSATRVTTTFAQKLSPETPLRLAGKHQARVIYRDGDERESPIGRAGEERSLTTSGEFGPILGTALLDAAQGSLTWSRWEQGPAGPEAVFTYAVDAKESHYKVDDLTAAYRGEIAIDSADGAILRIVLRLDPEAYHWLLSPADMEVEYGPVVIGDKTYICPVKGVAVSGGWENLWLNDVVFEQYHLFRSDVRILPDFGPVR
jgi:hypothetical protein